MSKQEEFYSAIENGQLEVVKALLEDKRVDPSDDKNLAIQRASSCGHLEVVKALRKDKRVDPSDDNNLAIRWASKNGRVEVVKLLLKDHRVYYTCKGINEKCESVNNKKKVITRVITKWKRCMRRKNTTVVGISRAKAWWFNKDCIQYIFERIQNRVIFI